MITDLWLDDDPQRKPPSFSDCELHWTWVKSYEEAIEALKSGTVEFASLDHDLADAHYLAYFLAMETGQPIDTSMCKEKTGYDVLVFIENNREFLPPKGIRIHTMNPIAKQRMLDVVNKLYGRTFQYQYANTHKV